MGAHTTSWVLVAGCALAAAGCNQLFGLEPPVTGDDDGGGGDGSVPDDSRPVDGPDEWGDPTKIAVAADPVLREDDPFVSPDGLELYFSVQISPATSKDLYRARRAQPTGDWNTATAVAELNSTGADGGAKLARDGVRIYFTSNRPGGLGGEDIWAADRANPGSTWLAVSVHSGLSTDADDRSASPCDGRNRFVLASNRAGGASFDLVEDDTQGGVRALEELNTAAEELSPFLTEDCRTLYFASNRGGDFDLYVSSRDDEFATWSPPARLAELSTTADETDPWLSVDQRRIMFTTSTSTSADVVEATR